MKVLQGVLRIDFHIRSLYVLCRSSIYGVDNEIIRVNEIVSFFQESGDLLQKPKLFFIQTCRVQNGIDKDGAPGESSEKNDFVEKDNGDYMDYCHRNHLIH